MRPASPPSPAASPGSSGCCAACREVWWATTASHARPKSCSCCGPCSPVTPPRCTCPGAPCPLPAVCRLAVALRGRRCLGGFLPWTVAFCLLLLPFLPPCPLPHALCHRPCLSHPPTGPLSSWQATLLELPSDWTASFLVPLYSDVLAGPKEGDAQMASVSGWVGYLVSDSESMGLCERNVRAPVKPTSRQGEDAGAPLMHQLRHHVPVSCTLCVQPC